MVIFKRKTLPKINNKHGVVASAQQKGWMDADQTKIWIEKVWRSRLGGLGRRRGLLVYDVFEAHVTESVKAAIARETTNLEGWGFCKLNSESCELRAASCELRAEKNKKIEKEKM